VQTPGKVIQVGDKEHPYARAEQGKHNLPGDLGAFPFVGGGEGLIAEQQAFLRAERQPGGRRTFRLAQGEPLPTSHGKDVYDRVFGRPDGAAGVQ
jgi:hypothetical protein